VAQGCGNPSPQARTAHPDHAKHAPHAGEAHGPRAGHVQASRRRLPITGQPPSGAGHTSRPAAIGGRPHKQTSRAGHGQATRAGQPCRSRAGHTSRSAAIGGRPHEQASRVGHGQASRVGHQAQATRQGWPYYRRCIRAACGAIVYSRATPGGWPAPDGGWPARDLRQVACPAGSMSSIVGPPLAGGLRLIAGGLPVTCARWPAPLVPCRV